MPPLQQISLLDPLQRVLNNFKIFEKKLDKLQEDLNFHGHALSEVRYMVAGITSANMFHEGDSKYQTKTTAIQCDTISRVQQAMQVKPRRKYLAESITSTRSKPRPQKSDHGSRNRIVNAAEPAANPVMVKRNSSPTKRVISNRTIRRLKRQVLSPRKSPSMSTKVAYKSAKLDLKN